MNTITPLITRARADGRLTAEEWTRDLLPALAGTPRRASEEARAVLDLWADDGVVKEPAAMAAMTAFLRERGYPVAAVAPAPLRQALAALAASPFGGLAVPAPTVSLAGRVSAIRAENVTEPDEDFARVAGLAGRTTGTVTIAVLDDGFDIAHAALRGRLWVNPGEIAGNGVDDDGNGRIDDVHGWDFVSGSADVGGENEGEGDHGSHTAATAVRGTDRVRAIVCRAYEPLDPEPLAEALEYAIQNGARVVSMSFKVEGTALVEVVRSAMRRHPNVLFVKSAGNDGKKLEPTDPKTIPAVTAPIYPLWRAFNTLMSFDGYLPLTIAPNLAVVAAGDPGGRLADYSNFGAPYATVGARGSEVFSAVYGGGYQAMDGTSMATPHAAGLAARCLLLDPALAPVELKRVLIDTADRREGWASAVVAGGDVNAGRAIRLAALVGLVRAGATPEQAADRLVLDGAERVRLLGHLQGYDTAPRAEPGPAPRRMPPAGA